MTQPVTVARIQNRRGTQDQFNALYPTGYNGVGGFNPPTYTNVTNPNILVSGELALCTDSRRMFIGNINGEYIEVSGISSAGLSPVVITLPPASSFTTIDALTYNTTPFFNIIYDITDSTDSNWNVVGTNFSRNGELNITSTATFSPITNTPFPPTTPVTLIDSGVEINLTNDLISFQAIYASGNAQIQLQYMHNFPGTLTFSTSSIQWSTF